MHQAASHIPASIPSRPADCIRIDEVAAALKKMKRYKAPGLSRLVAEMILSGYWIYAIVL